MNHVIIPQREKLFSPLFQGKCTFIGISNLLCLSVVTLLHLSISSPLSKALIMLVCI